MSWLFYDRNPRRCLVILGATEAMMPTGAWGPTDATMPADAKVPLRPGYPLMSADLAAF